MSSIADNIKKIKSQIPGSVKLVAVSKTKPPEDILEAYTAGQRLFGENRVQEFLRKKDLLPNDIEWHLIGHLQTNKVRSVVPFVSMIQSVDSMKLLSVINIEAARINRSVDCLAEVHIAKEETKSGFSIEELDAAFGSEDFKRFHNVRIRGLMGMATFTTDITLVSSEFRYLYDTFQTIKARYFSDSMYFDEVSMGMSGDYTIAVGEGSTMIRIGSMIFGERNKQL